MSEQQWIQRPNARVLHLVGENNHTVCGFEIKADWRKPQGLALLRERKCRECKKVGEKHG